MIQFAIRDGTTLVASSCRCLRHPLATSLPSPIFSSRGGMSCGSFCRSPSMNTRTSPRLWSIPAWNAAVWPKLRRKLTTLPRSSAAASRAIFSGAAVSAAVVDVEHLEGDIELAQHIHQLGVQPVDVLDLVVHKHDHREPRRGRGRTPQRGSHGPILGVS